MNTYLEELGARFAEAAGRRGTAIERPALEPALAQELLELARAVAHSEERRFAPLAAYMAGVAAERLASGSPSLSGEALVGYIREVRESIPEPAG